jgi:hypothetical protein
MASIKSSTNTLQSAQTGGSMTTLAMTVEETKLYDTLQAAFRRTETDASQIERIKGDRAIAYLLKEYGPGLESAIRQQYLRFTSVIDPHEVASKVSETLLYA